MANELQPLPKRRVITADISVGSFTEHIERFVAFGAAHKSSYVCCVNAHMTAEASRSDFAEVVNNADFATADGMPVRKALSILQGVKNERVAGNDIMPALLAKAAELGLGVYLYGGKTEVQQTIAKRATVDYPGIRFAGMFAPPFMPIEKMDLAAEADRINSSGAHIIMVSLGCPKQERWMSAMKGRVNGLMLGLGGAFLLYAGVDTRAPKWMRDLSLEWLYRLWLEPGRLWKRYLVTNSHFLLLFAGAFVRRLFKGRDRRGEQNGIVDSSDLV